MFPGPSGENAARRIVIITESSPFEEIHLFTLSPVTPHVFGANLVDQPLDHQDALERQSPSGYQAREPGLREQGEVKTAEKVPFFGQTWPDTKLEVLPFAEICRITGLRPA